MTACKIPPLFRNSANYWREKLAAFLHDPPDKALAIRGHEERAKQIRNRLGIPDPNGSLVKRADQIASGLDRTFLPETKEGGFVNFREHPSITHPTGKTDSFNIGPVSTCSPKEILSLLQKDEEKLPGLQPQRSFALFHYFRHVLPWRLAKENVCGLSWRWWRLPADTRLPDHSIWQHCALTSALYSCYQLSPRGKALLMVFAITPVQDFIARSRKLRDYWVASLILSWLTAEGMKAVIFRYGSDHLIYPYPVGQPLIEIILDNSCGFSHWDKRYELRAQAATLPNRFVFLVPDGEEEEAFLLIKETVQKAWLGLAGLVKDLVHKKAFAKVPLDCLEAFERIFTRQTARFWEFHWAATPLLEQETIKQQAVLFPEELRSRFLKLYEEAVECGLPYTSQSEKFFYSLTHDFLSRGLAAEKLSPLEHRAEEPGIKCHLHPDLEALRFSCVECKKAGKTKCEVFPEEQPDENPRPSRDPCWRKIREGLAKTDFKETERLSAIGLIKRLAPKAVDKGHPLFAFFEKAEGFPSTTEMALKDWLNRAKKEMQTLGLSERQVVEVIHRQESPPTEYNEIEVIERQEINEKVGLLIKKRQEVGDPLKSVDRYYALLIMDGDHMGKLLAGGFAARWCDTLHPELVERLKAGQIPDPFWPCFWKGRLEDKRGLSPAVHGAISQALSEFALYTVPYLVEKFGGRLVYAGGDDVCAVFPVSQAIEAASAIAQAYNWAFVKYGKARKPGTKVVRGGQELEEPWLAEEVFSSAELHEDDRLLLHLGSGSEEASISISAGLLIVHHKWPLRAAIRRTHELLDLAKDSGRAALALELQRRAGERRTFVAGFRETVEFEDEEISVWEAFNSLFRAFASRRLSSTFAYRVRELEEGLRALSGHPEKVASFIKTQIKTENKQDINDSKLQTLCRYVTSVLLGERKRGEIMQEGSDTGFGFEALEISRFLGEAWRRRESHSA